MTGPWPAVDNWLDLLGNLWIGIVLVAVAAVPSWFALRNHRSIQENSRVISDVRDQVVNGHTTAMRSDIDSIREELAGVRRELGWLRTDVDGLRNEARGGFDAFRGDITEERIQRRAGDQKLRDEIDRRHPPEPPA